MPDVSFAETHVANISTEKGQVYYMMRYQLKTDAPENMYAQIYYQDLTNKKLFHTTKLGSLGEVKILNFNSLPSSQIINKHPFQISLQFYSDEGYSDLIGVHRQQVWFEMSSSVANVLSITLL